MEIEIFNDDGNKKYIKVFFVVKDNNAGSVLVGNQAFSVEKGIQLFVKKEVAYQIDKCELIMDNFEPKLRLKEGEEFEITGKTEEELRIEELKRELAELENA